MKRNRSYLKFVLLVMLCAALMFSIVSYMTKELYILRTDGEAEPFGNYARYENGEVVTLSPSVCFSGYISREEDDTYSEEKFYHVRTTSDGLMQITVAGARCEDDFGYGWDGKYFVEAWYDFLEIPISRQTDEMFLKLPKNTLDSEKSTTVLRYTLKGDDGVYIRVKNAQMTNFEWELPKGELESLQIYISGYVLIKYPAFRSFDTLYATYTHSYNRGLKWEEYISYPIEYIPGITAEKEEVTP